MIELRNKGKKGVHEDNKSAKTQKNDPNFGKLTDFVKRYEQNLFFLWHYSPYLGFVLLFIGVS
jgi:hypothetical protein